jgi:hypothetical protein
MIAPQVEYVGFVTKGNAREYTLRVRHSTDEAVEVTLAIANEAFLAHRVRYQDGPEICFLKLQKELVAGEGRLPSRVNVQDSDLEDYRAAHAPKPPQRRPKVAPPTA